MKEIKKALVLGGGGFIGSHLVKRLKDNLNWAPSLPLIKGLQTSYNWIFDQSNK